MKKVGLYEVSVILFFVVIPIGAVLIEKSITPNANLLVLLFQWFTFSGVGLRLFTAGLRQTIQPTFTLYEIFKISNKSFLPVIREIGFANMSIGTIGLLSLFFAGFRVPAAVAGGLYLGIAGIQHAFRHQKASEEVFAMITDSTFAEQKPAWRVDFSRVFADSI